MIKKYILMGITLLVLVVTTTASKRNQEGGTTSAEWMDARRLSTYLAWPANRRDRKEMLHGFELASIFCPQ